MFNFEKFQETGPYHGDFLISTHNNNFLDSTMNNLKFFKLSTINNFIYTRGYPTTIHLDETLFSGISQLDKKIIYGPSVYKGIHHKFNEIGEYYLLEIHKEKTIVRTDFFGAVPIYYGNGFVSNRLQLIFLAMKSIGIPLINRSILFTNFMIQNAFNQQLSTFDTIINNVKKLPRQKYIIIDQNITIYGGLNSFEILSPNEYHKYIENAAQEISDVIQAVLNSFPFPQVALTGGRDSRVIYAALVAMGKINDVQLVTSDVGSDRKIASGLVKKFGGSYHNFERYQSLLMTKYFDNLERFIGFYFFTKLNIPDRDLREYLFTYQEKVCRIGGGCGEIFRDFYTKTGIKFRTQLYHIEEFEYFFKNSYFQPKGFDEAFPYLVSTFDALAGKTFSQKLSSHYLEFRNTYHFGNRLSKTSQIDISPLASKNLFFASRGLPDKVRDTGRVLFDITKIFCEELAYTQYDSPSIDFSRIEYHKKSRFDGKELPITPDIAICTSGSTQDDISAPKSRSLIDYKKDIAYKLIHNLESSTNFSFLSDNSNKKKLEFLIQKNNPSLNRYIFNMLEAAFVDKYL